MKHLKFILITILILTIFRFLAELIYKELDFVSIVFGIISVTIINIIQIVMYKK